MTKPVEIYIEHATQIAKYDRAREELKLFLKKQHPDAHGGTINSLVSEVMPKRVNEITEKFKQHYLAPIMTDKEKLVKHSAGGMRQMVTQEAYLYWKAAKPWDTYIIAAKKAMYGKHKVKGVATIRENIRQTALNVFKKKFLEQGQRLVDGGEINDFHHNVKKLGDELWHYILKAENATREKSDA